MKRRQFVHSKESLLQEAQAILNGPWNHKDAKGGIDHAFYQRVSIVALYLSGIPASVLSPNSGYSTRAITQWVEKVDLSGFDALRTNSPPGRPQRLTEEQLSKAKVAFTSDPLGYGYNVWEGKTCSDYLLKTFGVALSVRQTQHILRHKLGLSLIRPRPFPSKNKDNAEARAEFVEQVREANRTENLTVVFEDEVHFCQTPTITRMWALKGSQPTVQSAPARCSIGYVGFVIPSTGELFVTKPKKFNSETMIAGIKELVAAYPFREEERLCIVWDNASWHKKAARLIMDEKEQEYQDLRARVTFLFVPTYSPDLNPIESCWRSTRRQITHNRYFATRVALEESLDAFFGAHKAPNDEFRRLCSFKNLQPEGALEKTS